MYSILPVGIMIFPRIYYVRYEHQHDRLPENVVMIGGGTTTVQVNPGVGNKNDGNGNNEDKKNDYNASTTTMTRSSMMEW